MKKIKITLEDKPKENKRKYSKYPRIDMNALAFASPKQVEHIQIDYIKQIKRKANRRILIPTMIIFVLLLTTICAISSCIIIDYNSQINRISATLERRENDIKDRNSKISSLNNEISDLKNKINDISNSSAESAQAENGRDFLENRFATQRSDNNTSIEINTRTCAYPDCDRTAQNGSYYCYSHECSQLGCHEQIANDYSRYCYIHKCRIVNCNNGATNGGVYCSSHECIYPGCHKKKTGISYCSEHTK